jgi:hypothetical protein
MLAVAQPFNLSTKSIERETPRGKPVASQRLLRLSIATSVSLHGARPWHQARFPRRFLPRELARVTLALRARFSLEIYFERSALIISRI